MMMINRIFVSVILLSIAGSIIGSCFLAAQNIIYKHTSANFVVKINKIAIFCFVIPFFAILNRIDKSSEVFSQYNIVVFVQPGTIKNTICQIREMIHFADIVCMIWFIGLIFYLFLQIRIYIRFYSSIKQKYSNIKDERWHTEFHSICQKKNIKTTHIKLLSCPSVSQPCVIGIKENYILIPHHLLKVLSRSEINIVLEHELTHLQKKDVPIKILIFVLNSLNWFNPLLLILKENLFEWIELGCDEDLTMDSSKNDKRNYIDLLVKLNEEQYKNQKEKTAICFSDSKNLKSLKKRIQNIMKKKNRITLSTKIMVLIGLISTIGSATAIAKEMDNPINAIFSNHVSLLDKDKYEFVDPEEDFEIEEEFNFIKFEDHIFDQNSETAFFKRPYAVYEIILEDGTRQEYRNHAEINTKHTHSFEHINIKEHTKHKEGSCTITTYAGKKCTACQYVYHGDILSENIYNPCKHEYKKEAV